MPAQNIVQGTFFRTFFGGTGSTAVGKPLLYSTSDEYSKKLTDKDTSNKDSGLYSNSVAVKKELTLKGSAELSLLDTSTTRTTANALDDYYEAAVSVPFYYGLMLNESSVGFVVGSYVTKGDLLFTSVNLKAQDKDNGMIDWEAKSQGIYSKYLAV
jgi:hypothetical protein